MIFASKYSILIGAVRPDACSSSIQSRIDSDCEPIAARAASKGRHLARVIKRKDPCEKYLTSQKCQHYELVETYESLAR
jgi:hypothetical protein